MGAVKKVLSYCKCRVVRGGLRVHLIPKVAHSSIGNTIGESVIDTVYPWEESEDYRVMVVRHPLDRIVSSWAFFTRERPTHCLTKYMLNKCEDESFEQWCLAVLDNYDYDQHFDKQVIFAGGQAIDALIKMENLNKEWPAIASRFHLPAIRFENQSKHDHWSTYYTPELRRKAEAVFSTDIILYNSAR